MIQDNTYKQSLSNHKFFEYALSTMWKYNKQIKNINKPNEIEVSLIRYLFVICSYSCANRVNIYNKFNYNYSLNKIDLESIKINGRNW